MLLELCLRENLRDEACDHLRTFKQTSANRRQLIGLRIYRLIFSNSLFYYLKCMPTSAITLSEFLRGYYSRFRNSKLSLWFVKDFHKLAFPSILWNIYTIRQWTHWPQKPMCFFVSRPTLRQLPHAHKLSANYHIVILWAFSFHCLQFPVHCGVPHD